MKRLETKHRIHEIKNGDSIGSSRIIFQDEKGRYFVKIKGEWKELSLYINKNDYKEFTLIK